MTRTSVLSILLVIIVGCAGGGPNAGSPPASPAASPPTIPATPPPLIERDLFFGDPEIAGGTISPDGRFIAFRKPHQGVMNIWVKRREEPFDAARPVTADTKRPVRGYFWSEDGKYILYAQDKGGDENFRVYAVDPGAPADATTGVPPARDLTPYEKVQARIYAVPERTPQKIIVGLNDRDQEVHDVYRVDIVTGKRELVLKNEHNVVSWVTDLDGNVRLGVRMTPDGGSETLRLEPNGKLTPIYTCTALESCQPVRFHKDGKRVYMETNKGDSDLTRLTLFSPQTLAEEAIETDPEKQVDFGDAEFSDATEELVATSYVGDRLRVYPRDPVFRRDYETVRKALPDGDVAFGSSTEDESIRLVTVTSDVDPGAVYLYQRASGKVELLYRPRPKLPIQHLAPMRPVRYTARDGVVIPAYLTTPKGSDPHNLPTVVLPHGGPWARDQWGYSSLAQFLANRGYAVLQPNFRASTGYGKRFLNLGNKQWGTGTMQHDLSDGVRWLVEQRIADPKRVAIMGGSYGGFATLAGVTFTPDLYAAGVDIVGPSSIITLIETIPPYWKPLKKMFTVRVGDPDDPKDAALIRAQSPLYSAQAIKAPLLVIQGANDPRVKQAESDQIVMALRDKQQPVEYLVAPDEGHGFAGSENRIAMYAAIERFLAKHLGGRRQDSMAPEISRRLATLQVDVSKVARKTSVPAAAAAATSFSGAGARPIVLRYTQKAQVQGRSLDLTSTLTVAAGKREQRRIWTVTEESKSAMGAGSDTTVLDGKTLLPLTRSIHQGPATIELEFKDKEVSGTIKAQGQTMPIKAAVDGPVVVDGVALHFAVGTLPLAVGFRSSLLSFDVMGAKAKPQILEVKSEEEVTVPAGKFKVYRIEIAGEDGTSTLWVERASPRRVVKWEATLPAQVGGGKVSAELTK